MPLKHEILAGYAPTDASQPHKKPLGPDLHSPTCRDCNLQIGLPRLGPLHPRWPPIKM